MRQGTGWGRLATSGRKARSRAARCASGTALAVLWGSRIEVRSEVAPGAGDRAHAAGWDTIMTGRFSRRGILRGGALLFLALVFTAGLTFATLELPYYLDGVLQDAIPTPDGDSHVDEVARLKTDRAGPLLFRGGLPRGPGTGGVRLKPLL